MASALGHAVWLGHVVALASDIDRRGLTKETGSRKRAHGNGLTKGTGAVRIGGSSGDGLRAAMPVRGLLACVLVAAVAILAPLPAPAQQPGDTKPYDERLLRLSEILGAVHYLRELCGNNDGQLWRERMRELIEGEGGSAQRRQRLTKSFNDGYRSYSRTYQSCTPTAQVAIGRFLTEGAQIADTLVKSVP